MSHEDSSMAWETMNEVDDQLHGLSQISTFAAELAGEMLIEDGHFRISADKGDQLAFCCYEMLRRVKELSATVSVNSIKP